MEKICENSEKWKFERTEEKEDSKEKAKSLTNEKEQCSDICSLKKDK